MSVLLLFKIMEKAQTLGFFFPLHYQGPSMPEFFQGKTSYQKISGHCPFKTTPFCLGPADISAKKARDCRIRGLQAF